MATSTIVWIVVIAVVVILVGLLIVSMRRKSRAEDHAQATDLRDQADTRAAGLPDLQGRVDQAEDRAATARLEAERAEDHAGSVRAEAAQQRAIHEDEIRAADRLDPQVDDRAKDYSPQVVDPVGPSNLGADNASNAETGSETVSGTTPGTTPGTSPETVSGTTPETTPGTTSGAAPADAASSTAGSTAPTGADAGSSITLEPTDTAPRDTSMGADQSTLHDRLQGESTDVESTDGTQTQPRDSGGAHRA